jgi:exo-beta-1,3-glucanase (GH17 family)
MGQYDTSYGGHQQDGYDMGSGHGYQAYQAYQPQAPQQAYHDEPAMYNTRGQDDPFSDPDVGARRGLGNYGGASTPSLAPTQNTRGSNRNSYYDGDPFNRPVAPGMEDIDPHALDDDGDDDIPVRHGQRRSYLPAAGGVAAGGAMAGLAATPGGDYAPVRGGNSGAEKGWLAEERTRGKKVKWIIIGLIVVIILAAVGGTVGYFVSHNSSGSDDSSSPGADSDLNSDSSDVQAITSQEGLYKVFPGMDYTPLNSQYPDCLSYPPSQDNVTKDIAVLSKLTNVVRLYGTDCKQTEMVMTAFERLNLKDSMQLWIGVWLDTNSTTNKRQLSQMWDYLDDKGTDSIAGLIVGNEILFREDMTVTELSSTLGDVRDGLKQRNMDLPLATSDLGSSWSKYPSLADSVDVVMSNIHPFFGGIPVDRAATWTWNFWKNNDVPVTQGTNKQQIISETGWPSEGGMDEGSVAGIDEMNTFMADFVCQSLEKNVNYFW